MSEKISQEQLFQALLEYRYIVYKDGQIIVTNDFYREFGDPSRFQVNKEVEKAAKEPVPTSFLQAPESGIITTVEIETLPESILTRFIADAEIPKTAKTKTAVYALNKFNTKAEKILEKILKQKINYQVLVMSTKLYYKSGVMPKTIANYFIEGIWKDEYNDLAEALKGGNANAQKYINEKKKEGSSNENGTTRFKR